MVGPSLTSKPKTEGLLPIPHFPKPSSQHPGPTSRKDAATEIKTVLEQIDAARASTQTDVLVALDDAIAIASRRLDDARAAAAKSRLARLRAESSSDTTDAIALVRLLHGDVLEDLDDDASQT